MPRTFEGNLVALATPFQNGALDEAAYAAHCDRLLANGVDGLVPCGTTGETPTLEADEQLRLIRIAVTSAKKAGAFVVAGAGSFSTAQTVRNVGAVREAGADGALVVTPYYNRPTQAGIVAHYQEIAKAHPGFPIVAYVVPGRTQSDILPDTYRDLAAIDEVVAVKEATASMGRVIDILERVGDRFTLLSGDDFTVLPFLACGGRGVISVTSNVAPRQMADLIQATLGRDLDKARAIQVALNALNASLFAEANPIPLKAALSLMGHMSPEMRLPLTRATEATFAKVGAALKGLGLLP